MTGNEQDQKPDAPKEAPATTPAAPSDPEPGHGAGGDPLTEGP